MHACKHHIHLCCECFQIDCDCHSELIPEFVVNTLVPVLSEFMRPNHGSCPYTYHWWFSNESSPVFLKHVTACVKAVTWGTNPTPPCIWMLQMTLCFCKQRGHMKVLMERGYHLFESIEEKHLGRSMMSASWFQQALYPPSFFLPLKAYQWVDSWYIWVIVSENSGRATRAM